MDYQLLGKIFHQLWVDLQLDPATAGSAPGAAVLRDLCQGVADNRATFGPHTDQGLALIFRDFHHDISRQCEETQVDTSRAEAHLAAIKEQFDQVLDGEELVG